MKQISECATTGTLRCPSDKILYQKEKLEWVSEQR